MNNLSTHNKLETLVKSIGVDVYSSTIAKLLITHKKFKNSIIFDKPLETPPPEDCFYCIEKYLMATHKNSPPLTIPYEYQCKKHRGISSIKNFRPAKIDIDNTMYMVVKNWIFFKYQNTIIEIYTPHVSLSIHDFNIFLLEPDVIRFYDEIEMNAFNITYFIKQKKTLWTHVADKRYLLLKHNGDFNFDWTIKMYKQDTVNMQTLLNNP